MPISAEEWRVRTGLNNVRVGKVETCVGKRMYKYMYDWKHNDRVFLTIIMIMVISSMISLLLIQNMWSDLSLLNTLYMTIISVLMALDFSFADTKHTSNAVTLVSSPVLIYARNETVAWHLGIVYCFLLEMLKLTPDLRQRVSTCSSSSRSIHAFSYESVFCMQIVDIKRW